MRKKSFEVVKKMPFRFVHGFPETDDLYEESLIRTIKTIRALGDALDGQEDILLRPMLKDLYLLAKQLLDYQGSGLGGEYSTLINLLAKNDGFDPENIH